MPKPNTMDDLVNEIIRTVKNGDFHGTIEINPIGGKVGKSDVKTSHEVIEQLLTAKLQEVDRAARIDELNQLKPPQSFLDYTKISGRDDCVICGFNPVKPNEHIEDRLNSLKGGDV